MEFPDAADPPLTDDELDYARRQAGLFGVQARWVSQRFGPVGRGGARHLRAPRRRLRRGRRGAHRPVADRRRPSRGSPTCEAPIAERATCIAGLAIDAQSDAADAADAAGPERVEGAWFLDGETRMDDQQHALAALLRTIPIVEARDGLGDPGDDAPSGWLWAAVLVLALNPARAAFGVPRAGRSPRERGRRGRRRRRDRRARRVRGRGRWAARCSTRST